MSDLKEMLATIEEHEVDDHIGRHGWGVVAKKLLKWLRYFMARSYLWKRKAKKWHSEYIQADELAAHYMGWWKEACEDADRRKELLKLLEWLFIDDNGKRQCPFCKEYEAWGHRTDCELAKELEEKELADE